MTLENVFVDKLRDDPPLVLNIVREYLWNSDGGRGSVVRSLIDKYVVPWFEISEDNEELARRILGLELMCFLRPV